MRILKAAIGCLIAIVILSHGHLEKAEAATTGTDGQGRTTYTFSYTGAPESWVVPSGVAKVKMEAWGAQGAYTNGGKGGYAWGEMDVTSGETLGIYVGGKGQQGIRSSNNNSGGAGGWNGGGAGGKWSNDSYYGGGGGGGASDIRRGGTALNNRVLVAAGGGGASGGSNTTNGGSGGAGGGLTGGNGVDTAAGGALAPQYKGTGATQTGPGSSGTGAGLGQGASSSDGGGGGGGGYYGGGASVNSVWAGGGGGSSFYGTLANAGTTADQRTGDGFIVITVLNSPPTLTLTTANNQTFSQVSGYNKLVLSGSTKDTDVSDAMTVKYTIDGVAAHTGKVVSTLTANGSNQSFGHYEILIDSTIPEGSHILRVWSEDDNGGKSAEVTKSFTVDKTAPAKPVISESPSGNAPSKTITITYAADAAKKEYQIDSSTVMSYTTPFTLTKNAKVTAKATDAAGNVSTGELTITSITPPEPIVETSEVSESSLITKNTRPYSDPVEYQFSIYEIGNATPVHTSFWQDQGTYSFSMLQANKKYRVKVDVRYK